MELEDVSAEVKWEMQRIGAAFGLTSFEPLGLVIEDEAEDDEGWQLEYQGYSGDITVLWDVDVTRLALTRISLTYGNDLEGPEAEALIILGQAPKNWYVPWSSTSSPSSPIRALLARHLVRSLYRCGFDEDQMPTDFIYSLSHHERLGLRLSLPREFWLQKWLDEEEGRAFSC